MLPLWEFGLTLQHISDHIFQSISAAGEESPSDTEDLPDKITQAHILFSKRILSIELIISSLLSCYVRCQICISRFLKKTPAYRNSSFSFLTEQAFLIAIAAIDTIAPLTFLAS